MTPSYNGTNRIPTAYKTLIASALQDFLMHYRTSMHYNAKT